MSTGCLHLVIHWGLGLFLPAPLRFLTGRTGYYTPRLFLPTMPDMMLHAGPKCSSMGVSNHGIDNTSARLLQCNVGGRQTALPLH